MIPFSPAAKRFNTSIRCAFNSGLATPISDAISSFTGYSHTSFHQVTPLNLHVLFALGISYVSRLIVIFVFI